jgi:Protein of unknown function (DUF4019)
MSSDNQIAIRRLAAYLLFVALLAISPAVSFSADATDADGARKVAEAFDSLFDNNQARQAWTTYVSQYFRDRVTEEAFVAQLSIFRSNFGGPPTSPRQLIQTQSGTDPATGQPVYSLRYKVQFPNVQVYQDLTFIKEGASGWKLAGIFFNPVPP